MWLAARNKQHQRDRRPSLRQHHRERVHTNTSTTGTAGTTNTDATTVDPSLEDQLNGVIPGFALSAPAFAATNMDGTSRGRPDLIGHPTVLWFYPLAETPG